MLLQRLVEYAKTTDDVLPPFYARKPVRFLLPLAEDGTPQSGLIDSANPDAGQRFGAERSVPAVTRTVGVAPTLAVDTVEYVLGWVADDGKPDRVANQHTAFQELIRGWAAAEPDGPAPAIAAFYANGHHRTVAKPPKWSRADLVAFEVNGQIASEHASAQRYWATVAAGRKGLGRSGLCLVCGEVRELLKTIPQQIPQRWLPGATQGASLVSINEAVHGYELTKFLSHTPICITCGLTFMSSLTALLADSQHSTTLPGQNARLVWWLVGGSRFNPMKLLEEPELSDIQTLLAAPVSGGEPDSGDEPDEDDLSTFCSVTVGGNVARVVVRDWVEQPLPAIKRNLHAWFADHQMADWSGQPSHFPLIRLARVAGRWQPGKGGAPGSWAKLGAKAEDRPQDLYQGLLRAALLRRPLPPKLLTHVINRIRIDGRVDPARVALIRLALRRRPGQPSDESERLTPTLNLENKDPAYLSGRAFAVLDDLQRAVYRAAGQQLNTTFAERYMGRAITNPRAVLVNGQRSATAWLRRLRGPLRRPSWATAYANRLADIFAEIDPGLDPIPSSAVLEQKALFILGYHQQRAAMRAERIAAAAHKKKTDLPPVDDDDKLSDEGEAE